MSSRADTLVSIVQKMENLVGDGKISIGELVQTVGRISFAPLLFIPALALASPLSGIPLFSSIMGVIIFLVSIQMLFRRDHVWLPRWLLNLQTSRTRVRAAFTKIHPGVAWLDRRTHPRLRLLTHRPFVFVPQLMCVISGLILPLLEFVPFSSSLVGLAVSLLSIGMFARDGVIISLALVPYIGIAWLILHFT